MIKECKICKIVKSLEEFHTCGKYKETQYYRGECTECSNNNRRGKNNDYSKEYNSRPAVKEKRKKYKQEIKKRANYLEKQRNYDNIKYSTDPLFKLKKCLRSRIKSALMSNGWIKHNGTPEIIGCSYEEFKKYIENQFTEGMTWENHGKFWEIEHIKALGFAITKEELYKLCHYSNIRPYLNTNHRMKSTIDRIEIQKFKTILRKKSINSNS